VASDFRKKKHAKYLTDISSNDVFIRILVNIPTKVKKKILAVKGLKYSGLGRVVRKVR
jgi:hypothetical protein